MKSLHGQGRDVYNNNGSFNNHSNGSMYVMAGAGAINLGQSQPLRPQLPLTQSQSQSQLQLQLQSQSNVHKDLMSKYDKSKKLARICKIEIEESKMDHTKAFGLAIQDGKKFFCELNPRSKNEIIHKEEIIYYDTISINQIQLEIELGNDDSRLVSITGPSGDLEYVSDIVKWLKNGKELENEDIDIENENGNGNGNLPKQPITLSNFERFVMSVPVVNGDGTIRDVKKVDAELSFNKIKNSGNLWELTIHVITGDTDQEGRMNDNNNNSATYSVCVSGYNSFKYKELEDKELEYSYQVHIRDIQNGLMYDLYFKNLDLAKKCEKFLKQVQ